MWLSCYNNIPRNVLYKPITSWVADFLIYLIEFFFCSFAFKEKLLFFTVLKLSIFLSSLMKKAWSLNRRRNIHISAGFVESVFRLKILKKLMLWRILDGYVRKLALSNTEAAALMSVYKKENYLAPDVRNRRNAGCSHISKFFSTICLWLQKKVYFLFYSHSFVNFFPSTIFLKSKHRKKFFGAPASENKVAIEAIWSVSITQDIPFYKFLPKYRNLFTKNTISHEL